MKIKRKLALYAYKETLTNEASIYSDIVIPLTEGRHSSDLYRLTEFTDIEFEVRPIKELQIEKKKLQDKPLYFNLYKGQPPKDGKEIGRII